MPNRPHPTEDLRFEPGTKIHDLSPEQLEAAGQHAVRELRQKGLIPSGSDAPPIKHPAPAKDTDRPSGKPTA